MEKVFYLKRDSTMMKKILEVEQLLEDCNLSISVDLCTGYLLITNTETGAIFEDSERNTTFPRLIDSAFQRTEN